MIANVLIEVNYDTKNDVVEKVAEIGLRSKMLVKDVMSSPVITIGENAPTNKVAELMEKQDLGCIIVRSNNGKPVGIITERDLVVRVLSKNIKPSSIKAVEVMTSPLTTIGPDATISEAARRMSQLNIRRLGVLYKGNITGLLSSKDVLAVMPELIEIIQERARIENDTVRQETQDEAAPLAGYCDNCRVWSDDLEEVNGDFLCEDCKAELEVKD